MKTVEMDRLMQLPEKMFLLPPFAGEFCVVCQALVYAVSPDEFSPPVLSHPFSFPAAAAAPAGRALPSVPEIPQLKPSALASFIFIYLFIYSNI